MSESLADSEGVEDCDGGESGIESMSESLSEDEERVVLVQKGIES